VRRHRTRKVVQAVTRRGRVSTINTTSYFHVVLVSHPEDLLVLSSCVCVCVPTSLCERAPRERLQAATAESRCTMHARSSQGLASLGVGVGSTKKEKGHFPRNKARGACGVFLSLETSVLGMQRQRDSHSSKASRGDGVRGLASWERGRDALHGVGASTRRGDQAWSDRPLRYVCMQDEYRFNRKPNTFYFIPQPASRRRGGDVAA
jgi:hypothetical protein